MESDMPVTSKVLREDMANAISDPNILWEQFRNKTVLVTGGTGLIGSAILRILYAANQKYGCKGAVS